jgi:hypothetical protein
MALYPQLYPLFMLVTFMLYIGSLDDLQAINAYLMQVQKFIDDIKVKYDL